MKVDYNFRFSNSNQMLQHKISTANTKKVSLAYLTTEMSPISNSAGFGDYIQSLVKYAIKSSFDVKVFAPKFGSISGRKNRLHQIARLSGLRVSIGEDSYELLVKSTSLNDVKIQIYILDGSINFPQNADMIGEDGAMDNEASKKAIFFCKGALETMHLLGWSPSIIHCNGWLSMFVPRLLKDEYNNIDLFQNTKIVSSIYNDGFEKEFINSTKLDMPAKYGYADIINSGIKISNKIIVTQEQNFAKLDINEKNSENIGMDLGEEGFKKIIDIYNNIR